MPTCTITTTDANATIASLPRPYAGYLAGVDLAGGARASASPAEMRAMLKPLPPDELEMWPVERRVGNVKNQGADLAVPISSGSGLWPAMGATATTADPLHVITPVRRPREHCRG